MPAGIRWLLGGYLLILGIAGVVFGSGFGFSPGGGVSAGTAAAVGALLTLPVLTAAACGWWEAPLAARLALVVVANGLELGWVGLNYLTFQGRGGGEPLPLEWIFAWPLALFSLTLPFVVVTRMTGWPATMAAGDWERGAGNDRAPLSLAGSLVTIAILAACLGLLQRAEGEWRSGVRPWAVAAASAGWGLGLMPWLAGLLPPPAGWIRQVGGLGVAAAASWGWWTVVSVGLAPALPVVWGATGFLLALAFPAAALRWRAATSGGVDSLR